MIRYLTRLVVAATIAVAATTGCSSGTTDGVVSRLRAERVMSAPLPGTTADRIEERPAGKSLGKSSRATVVRRLSLLPDADPDVVLAAAVDLAVDDGWTVDGGSPPPGGGWILRKPAMELRVNVQDRLLTITVVDTA